MNQYFVNDEPTGDEADRGTAQTEYDRDQVVNWVLGSKKKQIEQAQRRGLDRTKCEGCGDEIPKERLAAWPCATRCVSCQKHLEGSKPFRH